MAPKGHSPSSTWSERRRLHPTSARVGGATPFLQRTQHWHCRGSQSHRGGVESSIIAILLPVLARGMRFLASLAALALCLLIEPPAAGKPANRSSAEAYDTELQIRLVSDYVSFYNTRVVSIMQAAGESLWTTRLASQLVRRHRLYVGVVRTERNGSRGGHQLGSDDLVVSRLFTKKDIATFREYFSASDPHLNWLLLSDATFPDKLKAVYLPLNCKVIIAAFSSDDGSVALWESYQTTEILPKKTIRAGDWIPKRRGGVLPGQADAEDLPPDRRTPGGSWDTRRDFGVKVLANGVMRAPTDDPLRQRTDLTGLHLRCASSQYPPLTSLTPQPNKTHVLGGILGSFFKEMAVRCNFTFTCRPPSDGQAGALVNGEWTGIVRDIQDDLVDIGVAALDINKRRSEAVSFLQGIVSGGYRISMRRPTNDDYMWSLYTKQFSAAVWLMFLVASIVLMVSVYFVTQRSPRQPSFSARDSAFLITVLIVGQSTHLSLLSISSRLLCLVALLLQVLLLSYYTSDLVSSLTAGPPPPTFSTLEDIYNAPRLKFGFRKGSAIHTYFSEATDNVMQKLWRSIEENNYKSLSNSLSEGMARVLEEPYAYMEWGIPLRYNYGQDCRLYMLPTSYFDVQTSFPMKKNSPLIPILNKVVLEILSSGLLEKWWRDWSTETRSCGPLGNEPIGMKAVFGPFFMFALSLTLSLLVLGVEQLNVKWERKKRR